MDKETKEIMKLLKTLPKVESMSSPAWGGGDVPNQYIIRTRNLTIFQSYRTIIAVRTSDGMIILDKGSWDCSTTTGKYRNKFLGDDSKRETQKKIDSGEYILTNLN